MIESTFHALRDCPRVAHVWSHLVNQCYMYDFFIRDYSSWLNFNLTHNAGGNSSRDWTGVCGNGAILLVVVEQPEVVLVFGSAGCAVLIEWVTGKMYLIGIGAAHCLYIPYASATTPCPRRSQVSQGVSLNFWVVHRLMKQNSGVSLKGLVKPKLLVLSFNNIQLQVDSMVVYNCLNGIVVGNSCWTKSDYTRLYL
ncbi:hypothetical protein L195_g047558 [Trifolium pratense]|uniref:Uncharacterized protein n=1 Tax=Trifolium pratense TaxID=57577 RepID=A0A2K3MKT4_TRIPR|nr:hypothetical protein L195_g047558 [Trifolium pratense]